MTEEQEGPGVAARTRRTVLFGAGALGVSAVLAGCGSDDDGPSEGPTGGAAPTSGTPATTGSGGPGAGGGPVLVKASEVPVGGGRILPEQQLVVTQPTAGEFKAFSAICTHQGCPVSRVEGGTIDCTCHFSKFSITDGSVVGGPAKQPLPARPVKLDGENVTLA